MRTSDTNVRLTAIERIVEALEPNFEPSSWRYPKGRHWSSMLRGLYCFVNVRDLDDRFDMDLSMEVREIIEEIGREVARDVRGTEKRIAHFRARVAAEYRARSEFAARKQVSA